MKLRWFALEMEAWGYPKGMYRQIRVSADYWPMVGQN
jgi:hypothetical protein